MTSTNSSSNFLNMLKNNFRRHYVLFILFQIVSGLFSLSLISEYGVYEDLKYELIQSVASGLGLFEVICIGYMFILVAVLFREIYSKRAVDFHFANPVKRGSLFNANFFFGTISLVVSYIIMFIVCLCILAFKFKFKFEEAFGMMTGDIGKYLLMSFIAVCVLYAVFVMCACVAGRMWQYILSSFIATAVLSIGAIGFICYINTIHGVWVNLSNTFYVSAFGLLFNDIPDKQLTQFFIAAAAQFIVFYLAGYISFKKRKAEVAENSLSGKVLPVVLTVICFLAELFICLGMGNEISLSDRIMAAAFFVSVTAVILSAIFFRKAMTKPVLLSLVGTVLISALCVLSVQLIPEKTYINYVPESSEVETVTIYNYGSIGSSSIIDVLYGLDYLDTEVGYDIKTYTFSTDDGKDKFNQFHKKIISKETRENIYSDEFYDHGYNTISFEYKLKNGKTVARTYTVYCYDICKEYAGLLQTDEGFAQIEDLNLNPSEFIFAEISFSGSADEYEEEFGTERIALQLEDYKKLYECVRSDLQNAAPIRIASNYVVDFYINTSTYEDMKALEEKICITLYKFNEDNITEELKAKMLNMTFGEMYDYHLAYVAEHDIYNDHSLIDEYYYWISSEDENTIAYLKELGYEFKQ